MVLKSSLHGFAATSQSVKIDMYTWGVPFLLPVVEVEGIRKADIRDIAALKLEAIIQRKEEKDFRDVHALLQQFTLAELIDFFKQHYPHQNPKMLTDHLLAASFVEPDATIRLLNKITWEQVGIDIETAVKAYYQTLKTQKEQAEANEIKRRIEAIRNRKK